MSPRKNRIPELDGLRVLMIFIVSWYHIWQQSWLEPMIRIEGLGIRWSLDWLVRSGYVWVDGTVLMSVFLLFLPWAEAKKGGTPLPDRHEFWFRRAKRIIPGYYFIILLTFGAVCLPWGLYTSGPFLVKDIVTHLTFTFPFFTDTYQASPLGGAAWTLAILAQGYALFPSIAGSAVKRPWTTAGILAGVCFGFRAWCLWGLSSYHMVVNQLINFLDLYALGIGMGYGYIAIRDWQEKKEKTAQRWLAAGATVLFIGCFIGLGQMLRVQAGSSSIEKLQANQMIYRPVFGLLFGGLMLTAPFCIWPLRKIMGNRVTRFLGGISMNYYLIHQTLAVHLKRIHFPPYEAEYPNMAGEQPWQMQYTMVSFGVSLFLAIGITYLVERPGGKLMNKKRSRR